jgi:hypothetical protein
MSGEIISTLPPAGGAWIDAKYKETSWAKEAKRIYRVIEECE